MSKHSNPCGKPVHTAWVTAKMLSRSDETRELPEVSLRIAEVARSAVHSKVAQALPRKRLGDLSGSMPLSVKTQFRGLFHWACRGCPSPLVGCGLWWLSTVRDVT